MRRNRLYILTSSMLALTIPCALVLTSSHVSADNPTTSQASVTVPVACAMTSTGTNSHNATITPGTYSGASGSEYQNGIGKTTLTTKCNDNNGFSIYVVGYTGDTLGTNTLNGTSVSGNATIATGVYTQGDTTSSWSMKVDKITDTSVSYNPTNMTIKSDTEGVFSSWHSVPSSYTKVAEYHASTGSSATDTSLGAKVETTYAAYISPSQPADTYTGKVKYTMVHPYTEEPLQPQPSASGKICYYANASDAVGTMGCKNVASSVTLLASNFSRTNYGFAGWSDAYDYATNQNAKFYGPNETINIPDTSIYTGEGKGLSLYAVWVKSVGSLQDSSKVSQLCGTGQGSLTQAPTNGTASLSSVSALTDSRDNNTYAIAKLADGKCWMIENLRLESTAEHNSDGTLAQGYNSSFAGLATAESANFSNSTTANSLYSTDGSTTKTIDSTGGNLGDRFPRYNNTNTSARASSPTANTGAMYSYGNYYTWHAAIADTTYYPSGDHNTTSICPSGWQIPLGNTSTGDIEQGANDSANKVGGFSYLDRKMGGTGASQSTSADSLRWRKFPVNFLYSGYFSYSSADTRGSYGRYWSSTTYGSSVSYYLYLGSSVVRPGPNGHGKFSGSSIRCTVSAGMNYSP